MPTVKEQLRVTLNGTDDNPYMRLWGMTHNPFPQVAKNELYGAMMALNRLATPIRDVEHLRETLKPFWSDEFIELCCSRFEKGKVVRFEVEYEMEE